MLTHIEQYYQWLLKNPNKANHKILTTYKKLVHDIYNPKQITFYNEITEEEETHTYVLDLAKANRPIEFIEKFCRHSKGKWAGKPVELELFQKAYIQAVYGFVDKDTRQRKYKKGIFFVGRKNGKSTLASGLNSISLVIILVASLPKSPPSKFPNRRICSIKLLRLA